MNENSIDVTQEFNALKQMRETADSMAVIAPEDQEDVLKQWMERAKRQPKVVSQAEADAFLGGVTDIKLRRQMDEDISNQGK